MLFDPFFFEVVCGGVRWWIRLSDSRALIGRATPFSMRVMSWDGCKVTTICGGATLNIRNNNMRRGNTKYSGRGNVWWSRGEASSNLVPRLLSTLPVPSRYERTLVQAGHVTLPFLLAPGGGEGQKDDRLLRISARYSVL